MGRQEVVQKCSGDHWVLTEDKKQLCDEHAEGLVAVTMGQARPNGREVERN